MAGRRRGALRGAARGVAIRAEASRRETRSSTRNTRSSARDPEVPDIYREMLAEAGITSRRMTSDTPERPLKRPRTGRKPTTRVADEPQAPEKPSKDQPQAELLQVPAASAAPVEDLDVEEEDIEFEDVEIPKPTVQTTYLSSEDEESEEDIQFEDVDIPEVPPYQEQPDEGAGTLNLNLTAAQEALTPSKPNRKQPLTKAEKEHRVEVHRMHLLCLLAHVEKRNHWCNDPVVQETLRPLLDSKTVQLLNPRRNLTQFGQTESIKKGLIQVQNVFWQFFQVTEVGLRRALWAEDKADLKEYEIPDNIDNCLDKADFRKAAQSLSGSRDVGAQLCCALLRAVGVEARLVCSLQPLSFLPGGPTLHKPRRTTAPSRPTPAPQRIESVQQPPSTSRPSPRARLGHPNAAAYHIPDVSSPRSTGSRDRLRKVSSESAFPVYWTEVLDIGHQQWQPFDALVTRTHFRSNRLEPPASDRANALSYVVAFEVDGSAKDVTRRYAKAYNSKTRRMRIDGPMVPSSIEGAKWWRKALRRYKNGLPSDLDQIENNELNALEVREPMPRNVADFKDHPIYALERHFKRHEVLVPDAKVVGTVGAGSKGPLEKIYRRKDVRIARSADKWYRMGREIKLHQEPMKVLRKRKSAKLRRRGFDEPQESSSDEDPVLGIDPMKGTPIFTFDQTQLYIPPQVVAGRIPKNKFGNLDVYVPSMVPAGGVHIKDPRAGHAAYILGVDYAPALMGFDFKGRKGTAVYNGVVIPLEAADAVRAVLTGFKDLEAQMEDERRSRRALQTWKNWLRTLRIRRRLFEGDEYWGDTQLEEGSNVPEDEEGEDDDEEAKSHGGGFVLDDEGGGFEPGGFEPGGFEPGGFEPEDSGPGGFEPGGFEPQYSGPGGFEPGGFETGDFENDDEVNTNGKGKEPKPPIFGRDESTGVHIDGSDIEVEQAEEEGKAGGFPVEADVDMVDRPERSVSVSMLEEGSVHEKHDEKMADDVPTADVEQDSHGDGFIEPDSDAGTSLQAKLEDEQVNNLGPPAVSLSQERSEEDELEDAASDVTEVLYMDDDGSLID